MPKSPNFRIAAVVLAGGNSRRMGRDKCSLPFGSGTLLQRAISLIEPHAERLLLNCNEQPLTIQGDITVIKDKNSAGREGNGPMEGIVSALEYLQASQTPFDYLLTIPVDCPFMPNNFLDRLLGRCDSSMPGPVLAASHQRVHFTSGLWPAGLAAEGRQFLCEGGRAIKAFAVKTGFTTVEFPVESHDPFLNINTPEDYEYALSIYNGE